MTTPRLMDIEESVKWIDEEIFAKTGKRLDSLQISILEATSQGQKYPEIADKYKFSNDHVRKAAWKLWKLLSEVLGETVSQSNFRVLLQRGVFSNSNINNIVNSKNSKINVCSDRYHSEVTKERSHTPTQQPQPTPTQPHIDLGDAPEIFRFYDRTSQLTTLETWITHDRSRLIALLGISGIGKTTLALRLIEQIKTNFDYVIYRSLRFSPTLNTTLTNLLQIFSDKTDIPQNIETQISQLLDNLRKYRCLIILDDVQMLFSSGQLAGQYKTGYEDYQLFFKLIAEVCHHSCWISISWEKPREIAKLEKANNYVKKLVLGGLGLAAKEILKTYKLSEPDSWETLIDTYQGNPLWLELTASTIEELFGGSVDRFLQCEAPILDESLQANLDQQFQRLTPSEIAVMIQLAKETEAVALPDILKAMQLYPSDLVNAVRSLRSRLLVEGKEEGNTTFFSLNYVLKEYVKNRYIR